MKLPEPLIQATFARRYKRFFAEVVLSDGTLVTAHCPNTGSMLNCLVADSPCWLSRVTSPRAKLAFRLELVTSRFGGLAGINTQRANALVGEALHAGRIGELRGYESIRAEVGYGIEKSRVDWLLEGPSVKCYVEVKNVTLAAPDGIARFPDAVTQRGQRHLRELAKARRDGHRAVLFFCVQLTGATGVSLAADIDPLYAEELQRAETAGVEILAYHAKLAADEFVLGDRLPFLGAN